MKKIFLIGLAATAILTGCSKDETMEMASQKAIGFETFVNKSTRAVDNDVTNSTIEAFKVYGFLNIPAAKVFDGTKVTRSYGSTWSYTPEQYWTTDGKYWFAAVACLQMKEDSYISDAYTLTWPNLLTEEKCYGPNMTFNNETANAKQDLVYAFNGARTDGSPSPEPGSGYTAVTSESDNVAVPFNFKHLLSRVKFVFTNEGGNDQTILRITNLKITDAYSKGSISTDQTSGKGIEESDILWPRLDNASNLTVEFDQQDIKGNETGTGATATAENDYRYLIPGQSEFTITFTAQFFAADGNTELSKSKTFTFGGKDENLAKVTIGKDAEGNENTIQKGYSYVFKASLSRQDVESEKLLPITFTVESVEDWVTEDKTENETELSTTTD